ncbi:hypothetical protein B0F88_1143 [Methylobacter tundripaludum]|uniref:TspB protein n=1 Tax=Methylobacter tundripaludum TaxID=173365 RepID=A0A2S6GPX8_9GAMM|nr:virulence factor TspB C-terminal domain-related protein [Methylobacter tundripaludum]PPK67256.1 hypothetical protein B0F88_1143 [Methylobacter tundripaludum]
MDNIHKLIFRFLFLFLFSPVVFAAPALPTFGIVRAGVTTTYTVGPSTFQPISKAPTGMGIIPMNAQYSAVGRGYATTSTIPVGDTFAAVRVSNRFSAAAFAAAAIKFAKNPYFFAAVTVGSAIYEYFNDAGYSFDASGNAYKGANAGTDSSGAYCQNPKVDEFEYYNTASHTRYFYNHSNTAPYCPEGANLLNHCMNVAGNGFNRLCSEPYVDIPRYPQMIADLIAHEPADPAPVTAQIHSIDPSGSSDPVVDEPVQINLDTSPMYGPSDSNWNPGHLSMPQTSTPTAPKSVTTPSGQVQESTSTTTLTQPTTQSISATTTTTTNTINQDNSSHVTTVNNAPELPPESNEAKTDCDKYPDAIGCSKYGEAPPADAVQTVNVTATLSPTSLGSGSCPSPNIVQLSHGKTVTVSYQPECDLATGIAPLMIALAWLAAGMLVLSPVRG